MHFYISITVSILNDINLRGVNRDNGTIYSALRGEQSPDEGVAERRQRGGNEAAIKLPLEMMKSNLYFVRPQS